MDRQVDQYSPLYQRLLWNYTSKRALFENLKIIYFTQGNNLRNTEVNNSGQQDNRNPCLIWDHDDQWESSDLPVLRYHWRDLTFFVLNFFHSEWLNACRIGAEGALVTTITCREGKGSEWLLHIILLDLFIRKAATNGLHSCHLSSSSLSSSHIHYCCFHVQLPFPSYQKPISL